MDFNPHPCRRKAAFTLAEVLITLGIIGVVAVLTLPQLIDNYDKIIFETRAKAFYTQINEAFRRSYVENEEPYYWIENKNYTYAEMKDWLNKYLFPYLKNSEVRECKAITSAQQGICFRTDNGGLIWTNIDSNGLDMIYYPKGEILVTSRTKLGFQFVKTKSGRNNNIKTRESMNFIEPYTYNWNGTRDGLKTNGTWGCNTGCLKTNNSNCAYCTKLLQLNGWKVTKDYPW